MNRFCLFILFIGVCLASCRHTMTESEYSLDSTTILRQDWDNCMTKLTYFDNKKGNDVLGSALFYYPGRDGWFLVDNIFGKDGTVYLVLCDASPKLVINDSLHFIVSDSHSNISVDKSRWIRISSHDNFPVVVAQNKEYGSVVTKTAEKTTIVSSRPKWNNYRGTIYVKDDITSEIPSY